MSLAHALAPQITRRVLFRFFRPQVPELTEDQRRLLDLARRFKVRVNGLDLAAWRWGKGPAVLLVHGWDSRGAHLGRFVEPLLAAGWSVITYDAPAHGRSQGRWTHYFDFIDAVRALLASQPGAEVRAVVGHSLGGAAVLAALNRQASPLPTVLLAPSLRLKEMLERTFSHYGVPESVFLGFLGDLEKKHGYQLAEDNPWDLALKVATGFLLIHDLNDPTLSVKDTRHLAAANRSCSLITTQGLGHNRIISDPGVIDSALQYLTRAVPL